MLTAGSRIGHYEIVALLGAGGMGEVYRARDPRIGREVALKVLPAEVANDRERLARFDQEARAAGMLNHPNLLMIHELGIHDGQPYIVSELLEGTTLRERMSGGPIAQRKAIDYASQIAEGLATAHERGIVHRDLKPENIFITKEGRAKILDFGLAKLRSAPAEVQHDAATIGKQTDPGTVLGSAGYMSPEQVRGESVDHRSDIFSFGVILYEMLTGQRAFKARSSVETMNAILNSDPPEISSVNPQIGAALQRIVDHCLEKHREGRFQSARDLAFDLAALSDLSTSGGKSTRPGRRWLAIPLLIAAAIAVFGAVAFLAGRLSTRTPLPRFTRVTFHSAFISGARFAPDGQSIVYSSSAAGRGQELYVARLGSPEERALGVGKARMLSMSSRGEMAILLRPRSLGVFRWTGTLARIPLAGGAPREIATDVEEADWSPRGDQLAIIRVVGGQHHLEFPIGKTRYQAAGWLSDVRISPDGKTIAFIDHPGVAGDEGRAVLIDAGGKPRPLSGTFSSIQGLAWSPDGQEIWFTAAKIGTSRELYAITMAGKQRRIVGAPGVLTIRDIGADGRVLLTQSNARTRILGARPGETAQRELGWLDWGIIRDVSSDGKLILFDESGEGGGQGYSVYVRPTDGSPAVRLGEGTGAGFSPDGRWALAIQVHAKPPRLMMYPIGAGESRFLRDKPFIEAARFLPDGRVVATAHEPNRPNGVYLFDLAGGTARPISPEGFRMLALPSPDGQYVLALGPERARYLIPTGGGPPRLLKNLSSVSASLGFTPDGKSLLWFDAEENPLRIMKMDINTERSVLWKEIPVPPSERVVVFRVSPDGNSYAYSSFSDAGDVYVLEGVR